MSVFDVSLIPQLSYTGFLRQNAFMVVIHSTFSPLIQPQSYGQYMLRSIT